MDLQTTTILSVTVYKLVSLLVGLGFSYMGYRLFMAGVWGQAGELDAQLGDNKIVLKQAAPGTFFALFGTAVVAFTIIKGFETKTTVSEVGARGVVSDQPSQNSEPDNPDGTSVFDTPS